MDSNRGVKIWKVLALCSAVGLGGGYVWQRQKAAAVHDDRSERPQEAQRTVLPGSKSPWGGPPGEKIANQHGKVVEPPEVLEADLREEILRGGDDFGLGEFVLPDEGPEEPVPEKTVLPGSKSIAPLLEHPDRKPAEPEPPVKPGKVEP